MSDDLARPLGLYPHLRAVGDLVLVSGTSARRTDDTIEGADVDGEGNVSLDIATQVRAVLNNVERTLDTVGLDRHDLVDVTSFLVDMDHFAAYNRVWSEYFEGTEGPARTTVAVHQLPHPHLLIEIKAIARRRTGVSQ